jgi:hypothetical protein
MLNRMAEKAQEEEMFGSVVSLYAAATTSLFL